MAEIYTHFSPGDTAWCTHYPDGVHLFTIGQVRVVLTSSPGRPGETLFDNYKPQSSYIEEYMCVETGIGSGSVYTLGVHIFATRAEADSAYTRHCKEYNLPTSSTNNLPESLRPQAD